MLDEWYTKNARSSSKTDLILKKTRKEGSPSSSLPPSNAPAWTIDKSLLGKNSVTRYVVIQSLYYVQLKCCTL